MKHRIAFLLALAVISIGGAALANGGPFIVVYPNGDPSAKGDLARVEVDLMPHRETRLRVLNEDLVIRFKIDRFNSVPPTMYKPRAEVTAAYEIENPTDKTIIIDFGFPVLRGGTSRGERLLSGDTKVALNGKRIQADGISLSMIYGVIRQRAYETINHAIASNPELNKLVKATRRGDGSAQAKLIAYLREKKGWNPRDAALMAIFPLVDHPLRLIQDPHQQRAITHPAPASGRVPNIHPFDRITWPLDHDIPFVNLGLLSVIGEQKATQYYAQLASCLDPKHATPYETIFAAWGGDVRERSVDMGSGKVRPRELSEKLRDIDSENDRTVYARVDYLDSNSSITDAERLSCKIILKNLPVVFTFAPMDLLHYRVEFPPKSKRIVSVSYTQPAYTDTRAPRSYQLAYVLHPASLWKYFGPINLKISAPTGVPIGASVPCRRTGSETIPNSLWGNEKGLFEIYRAVLKNKSGELYVAVDATSWDKGPGKLK